MMARGSKSEYTPQNPAKYKGTYPIVARSSWEREFMIQLDINDKVVEWSYEPYRIPYSDPVGERQSIYIPDFLFTILVNGELRTKLAEIKPMKEQLSEFANTSQDALLIARNNAKWEAATAWALRRGIEFIILNEADLFSGYEHKQPRVKPVRAYVPAQVKKIKIKAPKVKSAAKRVKQASKRIKYQTGTNRIEKTSTTVKVKRT